MNKFRLPKLYPLTDATLSGLSHAAQVERFIAGGAEIIQLREKHLLPQEFFEVALESVKIARQHRTKIIINDRVDVALASKADGVHLGQTDLPPSAARQILGENAIIGLSTHSVEQAVKALREPIDYIAIGPIFETTTKENPADVLGLEKLKLVRAAIKDFALVAIGGITRENACSVIEAGADSVAVISALFKEQSDLARSIQNFNSLLNA